MIFMKINNYMSTSSEKIVTPNGCSYIFMTYIHIQYLLYTHLQSVTRLFNNYCNNFFLWNIYFL